MRKYLVFYYNDQTMDWEYQRIRSHSKSVKNWLSGFEKSGFSHAYEVQL